MSVTGLVPIVASRRRYGGVEGLNWLPPMPSWANVGEFVSDAQNFKAGVRLLFDKAKLDKRYGRKRNEKRR
jgi:hypothetical protein